MVKDKNSFKNTHTFLHRKTESKRIRTKYPSRIPIIVEKHDQSVEIITILIQK